MDQSSDENISIPKRIILTELDLANCSLESIKEHWKSQNIYLDYLEHKLTVEACKPTAKTDNIEPVKREHFLIMRLAAKEQDIQEMTTQIAELKAALAPSQSALRNTLLDPAVNLLIKRLRSELEETRKKLVASQDDLKAWKFTPDSVTGKRLISKCRQLLQENEDIGKMIASGRLAKLEAELSMSKALCVDMKNGQLEIDDFIQEVDEDMEGMQSTIYFLQQQLKEAKDEIACLKEEAKSKEPRPHDYSTSEQVADSKEEIKPADTDYLDILDCANEAQSKDKDISSSPKEEDDLTLESQDNMESKNTSIDVENIDVTIQREDSFINIDVCSEDNQGNYDQAVVGDDMNGQMETQPNDSRKTRSPKSLSKTSKRKGTTLKGSTKAKRGNTKRSLKRRSKDNDTYSVSSPQDRNIN